MDKLFQLIFSLPNIIYPDEVWQFLADSINQLEEKTFIDFQKCLKTSEMPPELIPSKKLLAFMAIWFEIAGEINGFVKNLSSCYEEEYQKSLDADLLLPLLIFSLPDSEEKLAQLLEKLNIITKIYLSSELGYTMTVFYAAAFQKKIDLKMVNFNLNPEIPVIMVNLQYRIKVNELILIFTQFKNFLIVGFIAKLKINDKKFYDNVIQDIAIDTAPTSQAIMKNIIKKLNKEEIVFSMPLLNDYLNNYLISIDLLMTLKRNKPGFSILQEFAEKHGSHAEILEKGTALLPTYHSEFNLNFFQYFSERQKTLELINKIKNPLKELIMLGYQPYAKN